MMKTTRETISTMKNQEIITEEKERIDPDTISRREEASTTKEPITKRMQVFCALINLELQFSSAQLQQ